MRADNQSKPNLTNIAKPARQKEERLISLEEILQIIWRRKFVILFTMLVSLCYALYQHYSAVPEYHAQSVILIKGTGNQDLLAQAIGTAPEGNSAVNTDVELLMSMPIAKLVVNELYKSSRRDSLEFFGKRRYRSPVARLISSFTGIEAIQANQQSDDWIISDDRLRYDALRLNSRIRIASAKGTSILKVSVASPFADEAVYLTDMLCQVYRDADISRNSEKYTHANRFIAETLKKQAEKVAQADDALSNYMKSNEIFEPTANTNALLGRLVDAEAQYKTMLAQYNITNNSLAFLENKLSETDKAISEQISKNVTSQLGAIVDELKWLENDYIRMVRIKGFDDPEIKAKRQQLDVVKTRYEQLSRSKIAGEIGYAGKAKKFSFDMVAEKLQIERKLNELKFSANQYNQLRQFYENQLSGLPQLQLDYVKLQRDRDVVSKTYLYLKEKLDETNIILGSEIGGISIIGSAFKPFVPEKPSFSKNLLTGLVLGGLLAAILTFLAEHVDDTIKDEVYFKDIGLPLLAFIPLVSEDKKVLSSEVISGFKRKLNKASKGFRSKISVVDNGKKKRGTQGKVEVSMPMITDSLMSVYSESFRRLRMAIDYSKPDLPLNSILVSGTSMSEGKSTVCCNLGMAFAMSGKKTVIVDCDFRRASIHNKFNGKREKGLIDYLFSEEHTIDNSFFQKTHVENLVYLSAGKWLPNPTELLGSVKMLELIKNLEEKFDKVLIDSPPLFISDAAQLACSIDGILLVTRLYFTNRKPIKEIVSEHFFSTGIIGVALIGSRQKPWYGYGKYGYGNYEENG